MTWVESLTEVLCDGTVAIEARNSNIVLEDIFRHLFTLL
jgi:hypothetical protein